MRASPTLYLGANLDLRGGPSRLASTHALALEDLLDVQDIAGTDGTRDSVWDGVDAHASVELGGLALVDAADLLESLLGLQLVLDTGHGVHVGHVTAGAAAGEVVGHAANVDGAPGVLLKGLVHARDDQIGAEVQGRDRVLEVGVNVLDRLLGQAEDGEVVGKGSLPFLRVNKKKVSWK